MEEWNNKSALVLSRENRVMIEDIKEDIKSIKIDVQKLSNHYSQRLPAWATLVITILSSLVTGLIVAIVR